MNGHAMAEFTSERSHSINALAEKAHSCFCDVDAAKQALSKLRPKDDDVRSAIYKGVSL